MIDQEQLYKIIRHNIKEFIEMQETTKEELQTMKECLDTFLHSRFDYIWSDLEIEGVNDETTDNRKDSK